MMARNLDALFDLVTSIQTSTSESAERLSNLGKEIGEQVSDIRGRVISVEGHVAALTNDMRRIDDNTSPLPVRIAINEQRLMSMESWKETASSRRWMLWVAIVASVLSFVTALTVAVIGVLSRVLLP